jgi:hypothetical protein
VTSQTPWFFSRSPERYVVLGGTVLFVALQILRHMGFSTVITLGLDHDYGVTQEETAAQDGFVPSESLRAHFRPDYYESGKQVHINFEGLDRAYRLALEAFQEDGREILNASPGTKLDVFPQVDFDSLF